MKNYRWHNPDELPEKGDSFIYFLYKKKRRWKMDSGWYFISKYENDNGEIVSQKKIDIGETTTYWKNITKWCYDFEFNYIIQKTFRRQRVYHLRNR